MARRNTKPVDVEKYPAFYVTRCPACGKTFWRTKIMMRCKCRFCGCDLFTTDAGEAGKIINEEDQRMQEVKN